MWWPMEFARNPPSFNEICGVMTQKSASLGWPDVPTILTNPRHARGWQIEGLFRYVIHERTHYNAWVKQHGEQTIGPPQFEGANVTDQVSLQDDVQNLAQQHVDRSRCPTQITQQPSVVPLGQHSNLASSVSEPYQH
jgi:hypothetical protein